MITDTERLDYLINEAAVVEQVRSKQGTRYQIHFPISCETQTKLHKAAREAIDEMISLSGRAK